MGLNARLRYEILRRDNHTCRYCGRSAPDVALEVDHVVPVSLGGSDQPENLVTACPDCNSGKASATADATLVADVAEDALRWRRAMEAASKVLDRERDTRLAFTAAWEDYWNRWTTRRRRDKPEGGWEMVEVPVELQGGWELKVWELHEAGLPLADLCDAVDVAMGREGVKDEFAYFIGVARQRVHVRQQVAREMLDRGLI